MAEGTKITFTIQHKINETSESDAISQKSSILYSDSELAN